MANPALTLITNAGPYYQIKQPNLRKAITIYGKLGFGNAAPYNYNGGGVAIAVSNAQQAVTDMRNAIGMLNPEQIAAARAYMWARAPVSAFFAGIKTTLATQSVDPVVTYLASLDPQTLELMDLWGEYVLNVVANAVP